jgi:hypothetical protein
VLRTVFYIFKNYVHLKLQSNLDLLHRFYQKKFKILIKKNRKYLAIVVAVGFQITFYVEIHTNDIFFIF